MSYRRLTLQCSWHLALIKLYLLSAAAFSPYNRWKIGESHWIHLPQTVLLIGLSHLLYAGAVPDRRISPLSHSQEAMGGRGKVLADFQFWGKASISLENLIISPAPPTADPFAHRLPKIDTKVKHSRSITLLQCYEKSVVSFKSSPAAHSSITASAWITNVKQQTLSTRAQSGQDLFIDLFKENSQYIKVFSFSCSWGQDTSKRQHTLEALSILDRVVKA